MAQSLHIHYYGGYYSTQASNTAGWYSETSTWHSGGSAAESHVYAYAQDLHTGVLSDQAYLKTVLNGPGTLSFYWKLTASTLAGNISFYVDGKLSKVLYVNPQALNSPQWTHVTVSIGPGQHTVTWEATALPHAGHTTIVYANVDTVTWTRGPSLRLPLSPFNHPSGSTAASTPLTAPRPQLPPSSSRETSAARRQRRRA